MCKGASEAYACERRLGLNVNDQWSSADRSTSDLSTGQYQPECFNIKLVFGRNNQFTVRFVSVFPAVRVQRSSQRQWDSSENYTSAPPPFQKTPSAWSHTTPTPSHRCECLQNVLQVKRIELMQWCVLIIFKSDESPEVLTRGLMQLAWFKSFHSPLELYSATFVSIIHVNNCYELSWERGE